MNYIQKDPRGQVGWASPGEYGGRATLLESNLLDSIPPFRVSLCPGEEQVYSLESAAKLNHFVGRFTESAQTGYSDDKSGASYLSCMARSLSYFTERAVCDANPRVVTRNTQRDGNKRNRHSRRRNHSVAVVMGLFLLVPGRSKSPGEPCINGKKPVIKGGLEFFHSGKWELCLFFTGHIEGWVQ